MNNGQAASRTVVSLWQYKADMIHPVIKDLIAYWEDLRAGRVVPDRADIDPRAMVTLLNYTFILDRVRPGVVRFRLSGTHLNTLMGMEVRGMPIRAFFELRARSSLMEYVEAVFTGPNVLDLNLTSDAQGRRDLNGRMTVLPLRSEDGQINRAIGAFVTEGHIDLPPRRFRIRQADMIPLYPLGPGRDTAHKGPHASTPGLGEPPATSYVAANTCEPSGSRPGLRVLKGGKD
ncbi:PAS domain-containing protein [Rhodophyticola sp. CCM32]|uniref:PAS domain-containing protein n=1 Tax=Rhodophyticola sp. CCM32 TaxID=2916397 RepID=UPI00143D78EE|nr:PAS domain-containing protein [Rhodophyticola sp. CCM32]